MRPTASLSVGAVTLLAVFGGGIARAQTAPDAIAPVPPAMAPEDADSPAPLPEAVAPPDDAVVPRQPEAALIEAQIRQNQELAASTHQWLTLGGYIDFGFFVPQGDGSGYVQVFGDQPIAGAYTWKFAGDILAPAINSRGEVADLGSAAGVNRFDSINSRGAPGFILNEVNLRLRATPAPNAIISTSVNFTPRTGSNFALGDSFDVDIAQLEWLPTQSQRTSIFVGKMESVFGIEYRDRKSDHRFGVTPSLIARYTTGTTLGVKVRSKFGVDDWLVVAAAITNGSNTTEQFFFYDETDSNAGKTGSARVAAHLPLPFAVEIGLSGSYGAQDRTTSNRDAMWFVGPDLLATLGPVDVKAQWITGYSAGDAAQNVYRLDLHGGGYVELDAMLSPSWGILGRAEYRHAEITLGSERDYLSKTWRATFGVRCILTRWAVLKAEYLLNREYGGLPQVPDDVFTSSLVLSY